MSRSTQLTPSMFKTAHDCIHRNLYNSSKHKNQSTSSELRQHCRMGTVHCSDILILILLARRRMLR
jgi:hypothetical protein